MPPARTRAPLLPVNISQSPLLSGPLPDDLLSALAKPLPTITIGFCESPPAQRPGPDRPLLHHHHHHHHRHHFPQRPAPPLPPPAHAPPRLGLGIAAKDVIALLNLLETMENDVATEVQRVRLGIQEARTLVRECREDCRARAGARQAREERERRDTKGADDDFWLGM